MKKKNFILMFFCILGFCSCKKNHDPVVDPQVDIYMAGWESIPHVATYWKNDAVVHLTDQTQTAEANAIVVSGNDVYVAGSLNSNAVYWKNGTPHILAYSNSTLFYCVANSIAVSGNDVYVAGTIFGYFPGINLSGSVAAYWKNNVQVNLTPDIFGSEASSITVSGNDVYIAGNSWEPFPLDSIGSLCGSCKHYEEATYWKNGVPVYLTDGSTIQAHATGIAVSGTDVYVCGNIIYDLTTTLGGQAAYWKNGSMVNLADNGAPVRVSGIAASGNDVYVTGTSSGAFSKALYWKNGIGIPLQGTGQQVSGMANAITVDGNDVYVAGNLFYLAPGGEAAKCWKNNEPVASIDSTRSAFVKSIYVVKK